jgi:hypothetical protein
MPYISLAIGNHTRLRGGFLAQRGIDFKVFDLFVFPESRLGHEPNIYYVSTNHKIFNNLNLPKDSRVIDPWGMKNNWGEGVYVLSLVGIKSKNQLCKIIKNSEFCIL